MQSLPHFQRVEAPGDLPALAEALEGSEWHALDSESNSGFAYRERLCLLQLNVGGRLWLVDLVALPGDRGALEPLRGALEDTGRTTYVHGGEFDVGCLKRDYGIALQGVWDSQQAASFLGWERTGYGALAERLCGVELPKAHAHHDWAKRPLADEPLTYALDDVRYMPEICRRLAAEVAAAGIEEEVAIANRVVEEATWSGNSTADFWRVKGAGGLPPESRPLLAALLAWREEVAERCDLPPGRVLNQRLLLAISRRRAGDPGALRRAGLKGRAFSEWATDIARVVREARQSPPPVPPRGRRPPRDLEAEARGERLRSWRREEAARRRVTEQVVLPAAALRHLQQHGAGDLEVVPQLGAKRARLYGETLRRLAAVVS